MKYILSICLVCYVAMAQCQDFYDMNTIQTIEITFAQSNWDQLLDAEKNSTENYILAESVTINGTLLDSVGVKYKGNSTYSANQTKNPFHIELDTYKDHDYEGYKDIKLSNVAKDPSFLREVMSYAVIRNYMDAPLSNYANVYVNGNLIGLYSNSEAVSKRFVNDRFYSKDNTWRQQGAAADFGLAFPKVVNEVKFNGFITRLNPSNLGDIFERLYGGGNIVIEQSKYLTLGLNTASVFDLKGTAASENTYKNSVNSATYDVRLDNEKWRVGVKGESGLSSAGSLEDTSALEDFFVHAQLYFNLKK